MQHSAIVQKLWNYCNVIRDDGMSCGDYVEQLTYLLYLKMAGEGGSLVCLVPVLVGFLLCASALSCAHVRSSHG